MKPAEMLQRRLKNYMEQSAYQTLNPEGRYRRKIQANPWRVPLLYGVSYDTGRVKSRKKFLNTELTN